MCSVAGAKNPSDVEKMLQTMKHRSPDGEGIFYEDGFAIGMGRLKIIDLTDLPLPFKKDGYVLSYNGEIYNYLEIKKELELLGHNFETKSDIEVVLESYKAWGEKCLDKFNGMFAFAIYNGHKLFLARDVAGEKPLYYRRKDFAFASEAKALNWDCEELPPATCLTYDIGSKEIVKRKYWHPKYRKIVQKDAVEELEALLEDSIRLRTQADVPYGLYFSGGVDSTLISTFHDFKHLFTFKDGNREDFMELFPEITWHMDYPVNHFSPYGFWKLAEMASREGVRVILSGEGADELFGGYVRYIQPHFNALARLKFPSYEDMFKPAEYVTEAGFREFGDNMQQLLRIGDRMASAFGIENRCPFLDKRIIEFAFNLPDSYKIDGLDTKVILNKILKKRKPDYVRIEKAGLFVPINRWLGVEDVEGYRKDTYVRKQIEALGNQK